jgi:hypothetical protein
MFLSNRNSKIIYASILSTILVSGLVIANPASAAKAPVIKVTPAKALKNGQKITVSGSGFTPKDSVYIVECLAKATGQADCNTLGATPATIDAKGKLPSTSFTVVTGAIGTKTCGTSKANANACDISVGNPTGGDSTTGAISFVVKGK